ncbi:MAG TPA: phage integrase SAM-like domain-containing protein [Candidatus Kapabacteria bacterium]|jgi:integrase
MKSPRLFVRGKYFWLGYYEPGRKNELRRPTGLAVDIPAKHSHLDKDWWKKSKHRQKLASILKDIEFERDMKERGYKVEASKRTPEFLELFEQFNEANAVERDRERSKATLRHRKNAVDFFRKALGQTEWDRIDRPFVLELRAKAKATKSPYTIRGYFVVLKMLFEYAVREAYIQSNPFAGVTVTVPKIKPQKVSMEEQFALFRFLYNEKIELFEHILFERLTGIRGQDICDLTWDNAHDDDLVYYNAKGRRWETIPLSKAAKYLLGKIPHRSKYIFAYRALKTVGYYLQRAASFGAPRSRTHQMKRSFLQELLKVSPDGITMQALAHHSPTVNKVVVEHYTGKDRELMASALDSAQKELFSFIVELYSHIPQSHGYPFANPKAHTNRIKSERN